MSAEQLRDVMPKASVALTSCVIAVVLLTGVAIFVPDLMGLQTIIAVLVMAALALSWPRTGRLVRATTIVSLLLGAALSVFAGATTDDVAAGFTRMSAIFVFFVLVRLLELPVISGNFHVLVAKFLSQNLGIRSRAQAGTAFTFGLTTGLSVGAVPIAYRTIEELWEDKDDASREYTARITAPGFTAANLMTPVSPIVALTVQSTGVSLPLVVALMIPFAIFLAAMSAWSVRGAGETAKVVTGDSSVVKRGAVEFFIAIGLLVIALLAIDELLGVGPMAASTLAIAATIIVWEIRIVGRGAPKALKGALSVQSVGWPEHFTLFCSGGLLVGGAIALTRGVGQATELPDFALFLTLAVVPVAFVLVAILGLYPFVTLAALGTILTPLFDSTSLVALALSIALITGASAGFLMSPFSGQTLLVSTMARVTSFKVGLDWNRSFGILLISSGTALALLFLTLGTSS